MLDDSQGQIDGSPISCSNQPLVDPRPTRPAVRFPIEFVDTMRYPEAPVWLVKGLVPTTGLLVLYGVSGSGKSFLALDVALHIAAGRSWAGRRVRQAGVVYVASEAGQGMRKRALAAIAHHGFPRSIPFGLITVAPDLGSREGDARTLVDDIRAQVPAGFAPGLIILDTLARSMVGADESGSTGMGIVVANAELIGRELGALCLAVHHAGKDFDRGLRGSSSLHAAADAIWQIAPDGSPRVRIQKMKEDRDGDEIPFRLRRVTVSTDRDGDEITTCVVDVAEVKATSEASTEAEPANEPPVLSDGTAAFYSDLVSALIRLGTTITRYRTIPKGVKVLRQAELGECHEIQIGGTTPKSRASQINRYVRELEGRGLVCRHAGYLWLSDSDVVNHVEK